MSPIVLGMSVQEALDLARARVAELGANVPGTLSLMVQRLSQSQQTLFAKGAQWNPDYFGTCIVGTLDGSALDLLAVIDPLEIAETITRIEIADPGSSELSAGQEVNPVTLADMEADRPPRCLVRRKLILGVGSDLNGVTSLRVFYSPSPLPLVPSDLAKRLEIPRPHDVICVLDLALYLLDKLPSPTEAVVKGREAIILELTNALAAFESHVRSYVMTQRNRFVSRPLAPPMRVTAPAPPTV
jgi:hypothetical protein